MIRHPEESPCKKLKGPSRWRVLLDDDSGQDLVEYALMASFFGIASYFVLRFLGVDIFNTYQSWIDPSTGTPSLWDPPDPSGGGS